MSGNVDPLPSSPIFLLYAGFVSATEAVYLF